MSRFGRVPLAPIIASNGVAEFGATMTTEPEPDEPDKDIGFVGDGEIVVRARLALSPGNILGQPVGLLSSGTCVKAE